LCGLLSRTDRKGDSKLGYNFTAGLFICWQIKKDTKNTKNVSSLMQNVWGKENLYTRSAALNRVRKEIQNRIFTADFQKFEIS
jgi:hypothetical protein